MAYEPFIDYHTAIARGLPSITSVHKFGKQTSLSTTVQMVWSRNTAYTYLASSSTLIIASDRDTDQTSGATGALTVEVQGVDQSFNSLTEIVTLKGFTGASTTNDFRRVFRVKVLTAGTNGYNNGRITVMPDVAANTFTAAGVPTTTGNVLAQVDSTTNQTLMCTYTVPTTFTAYLTETEISTHITKNVLIDLYVRPKDGVFQIKNSWVLNNSSINVDHRIPHKYSAGSDIEFRAKSSSTNGQVSLAFDMFLVQGNE